MSHETANPRTGLALVVIAAAQLMVVLDGTITNIALPSIQKDLHVSASNLAWIVNSYALAFGVCCSWAGNPATSTDAAGSFHRNCDFRTRLRFRRTRRQRRVADRRAGVAKASAGPSPHPPPCR